LRGRCAVEQRGQVVQAVSVRVGVVGGLGLVPLSGFPDRRQGTPENEARLLEGDDDGRNEWPAVGAGETAAIALERGPAGEARVGPCRRIDDAGSDGDGLRQDLGDFHRERVPTWLGGPRGRPMLEAGDGVGHGRLIAGLRPARGIAAEQAGHEVDGLNDVIGGVDGGEVERRVPVPRFRVGVLAGDMGDDHLEQQLPQCGKLVELFLDSVSRGKGRS